MMILHLNCLLRILFYHYDKKCFRIEVYMHNCQNTLYNRGLSLTFMYSGRANIVVEQKNNINITI